MQSKMSLYSGVGIELYCEICLGEIYLLPSSDSPGYSGSSVTIHPTYVSGSCNRCILSIAPTLPFCFLAALARPRFGPPRSGSPQHANYMYAAPPRLGELSRT